MTVRSFDSTHAVRFDLPTGSVRAENQADRLLLLPAAALLGLVASAPPEAADDFGRALGHAVGLRTAARLGDRRDEASVEEFLTQLAGEAALAGIGVLSIERWGRALVVVVEQSSLIGSLLSPLVSAAIEAASGRKASCMLLAEDGAKARVLVASDRGIERVRGWMASGSAWGDALTKLHGGTA